ncbi:hypothetical protein [Trichormus azollae]|uniref:hypothetical protein n=1 Tax=Trichormus azollae TaxID=1164 RepID=UPI00325E9A6B
MVNQATLQLEELQKLEKGNQLDSSDVPNQIIISLGEDLFYEDFYAKQVVLLRQIH